MKRLHQLLAIFLLMAIPSSAHAQTIGERLQSIVGEIWNPFFLLVAIGSAVTGLFLLVRGLLKIVEAAQGGGRSYAPGMLHIAMAALLIALPDVAGIGMTSVLGSARGGSALQSGELDYKGGDSEYGGKFLNSITGGLVSAGETENCLNHDKPAACIAGNVARNVVPMAVMALFAMVFIAGLASFAVTIMGIARSSERGEQSKGHVARLVTSVLLMNAPLFFTQVTKTMLGDIDSPITETGLDTSSGLLKYPTNSPIEVVQNYVEIIGHSFTILTFFGAWAFVRGIFMIKGVAEAGRQAGSYGMAATYIVAGILMANSKFSTCLVLTSFGGSGMGAGFCN